MDISTIGLNMQQADEAVNNVFNYLNALDLTSYLKDFKGKTVWDMMQKLEKDYPYTDKYSECLFDAVQEYEFVDYLNNRYNLNIQETAVYYIN